MYLNERNGDWFLDPKSYSFSSTPHPLPQKIMMKYNIITPNKTIRTQ